MTRLIDFKTQRQETEWYDPRLDRRLRIIIYALSAYCMEKYHKYLVITEIHRTEEERKSIYADDPEMAATVGVHEVWRGADVRTHDFTSAEVQDLVGFLNDHFEYSGRPNTALAHDVGDGHHLHIQVDGDGKTCISSNIG